MQSESRVLIFNVQRYSLHDGSGIRTTVFFKGCPLRCRWCCNPESQRHVPEILFSSTKCIGQNECGFCKDVCKQNAISFCENKAHIDFSLCSDCLDCVDYCPSQAISKTGREVEIDELVQTLVQDEMFYGTNGGVTLSGGEPLVQKNSILLLKRLKEEFINTSIETCGFVERNMLFAAAEHLDEMFFDVKHMNSKKHREFTGQGNEEILANIRALSKAFPFLRITVRTPVIPGFNDKEEELLQIEEFVKGLPGGVKWQKLPYHRYGVNKYNLLGRNYPLSEEKPL